LNITAAASKIHHCFAGHLPDLVAREALPEAGDDDLGIDYWHEAAALLSEGQVSAIG